MSFITKTPLQKGQEADEGRLPAGLCVSQQRSVCRNDGSTEFVVHAHCDQIHILADLIDHSSSACRYREGIVGIPHDQAIVFNRLPTSSA